MFKVGLTPKNKRFGKTLVPVNLSSIAWSPRVGTPQEAAFYSAADEIFFGGIAGAGKTDLLLGLALTSHLKSIIFRREYPQLTGVIERSIEIVGDRNKYNTQKKMWRLGRVLLEFGSCQYEKDKEKYQGRPHDLIGVDELTHFTKSQYQYLTGWNRTTVAGQRCRIVATGNPPSSNQGRWVIEHWGAWLDPKYQKRTGRLPAEPGELRWYAMLDGNEVELDSPKSFQHTDKDGITETITPRSRTFIPGRMIPDLEKTGYRKTLQGLPEPLRSQLLYGRFDIEPESDLWAIIPTEWVNAAVERWTPTPPVPQTAIGVDPSRGGQDETIIILAHGLWIAPIIALPGKSVPDGETVADQVLGQIQSKKTRVRIDSVGIGSSPYDFLKRYGVKPIAMVGGARSEDYRGQRRTDKTGMLLFFNKRAEWYWNLRELFDPTNQIKIAIPNDPLLIEDLTTLRWSLTSSRTDKGEIKVESKDELAKADRLGRSPDRGDALAYALAQVEDNTASWLGKI